MKRIAYYIVIFLLLDSCSPKSNSEGEKIFELLDPQITGVDFTNIVPENDTLSEYLYIYNGAGVAAGDINNDGLPDLFFTGNTTPAKLYLNKGNFKFEDITAKSGIKTEGWMTGVTMADINGDGFLDIYVCKSGPGEKGEAMNNLCFVNKGNLTFEEKAKALGIDDPGNTTCGTFFDYDLDGDLDLYVGNHGKVYFDDVNVKFARKLGMNRQNAQHLYRNDGDKFTDVSAVSGTEAMGYCLSATPGDFNNDGFTDLYVCNDYQIPDYYYVNNGDGTFTESCSKSFKHTSANSMGSDQADYNNDGLLDLVTVDMLPEDPRRFMLLEGPHKYDFFTMAVYNGYGYQYMRNGLQANMGGGKFSDLSFIEGVARTDWSWCPLFADFNNDGFTDLYITNGYYRDVTNLDFILYQQRHMNQKVKKVKTKEILDLLPFEKLSNYMFQNSGKFHFNNKATEWGVDQPTLSSGAAYADLNKDGHLDLIVCNQGDKAFVYKNVGKEGNYLNVRFKGEKNNTYGLGCKVIVEHKGLKRAFELHVTHGYQSSSEPCIHIGCGEEKMLDKITIIWPGGKSEALQKVKCNRDLIFKENTANGRYEFDPVKSYTFSEISGETGLHFLHQELVESEFKRDPLLPHQFTNLGPGAATGDVNGDGLMDVLISNGAGSSGAKLFLQKTDGMLVLSPSQPWGNMSDVDALGCAIFDADGDGDNDVYMVAGGSEYSWPTKKYIHRLYENNGKGIFHEKKQALPDVDCSGSCVTSADMDGDGDLDLFVAGRILPGHYPDGPGRSYILRNDDGIFHDVTEDWAPFLVKSPMLCAAVFADVNGDNKPDLLLAGEWTPVFILENDGKKFHDLSNSKGTGVINGWYNSLLAVDIDNDGDLDIFAGNKGQNSYVQADELNPLRLYSADVDDNGKKDFWLSYTYNEKEYPLYQLDEMALAFPGFIRKKFTTYLDLSTKTIEEIFEPAHLHNPLVARNFKSLLLRNDGDSFSIVPLPDLAQVSSIYGTSYVDINNDGYLDLFAIGNSYSPRVEHGRDDAANGLLLMNHKGVFTGSDGLSNGFYVPGDGKSLVWLNLKNKGWSLVANENSSATRVFTAAQKLRFVPSKTGEGNALVKLKGGSVRRENVNYGGGYLSCSQPGVWINDQVEYIDFISTRGVKRRVQLPLR